MGINSISMNGVGGFGPQKMANGAGPIGKAFQIDPANLSESEISELKEFGKLVRQGIRSGEFDAAALAEQAPEFIQTMAQENGTSVEETINGLFDRIMERKGSMGSRPPVGMGGMQMMKGGRAGSSPLMDLLKIDKSQLSDEQKTEIKEFENSVREAIMSGEFDSAALVESAPDFIREAAEESGIDIEGSLNDMFNKITEMRNSRVSGTGFYSGTEMYSSDMELLKNLFA